jgi:hypothetical protein
MSFLKKTQKTTVVEVYTYTFNENSTTQLSTGSNASVGNLMFSLYDKDVKNVGYIMFTSSFREITSNNLNYGNSQCGIFLNNNKNLLSFSNGVLTEPSLSADTSTISVKAIYGSGKYQDKDVTVKIEIGETNKRTITITYKK